MPNHSLTTPRPGITTTAMSLTQNLHGTSGERMMKIRRKPTRVNTPRTLFHVNTAEPLEFFTAKMLTAALMKNSVAQLASTGTGRTTPAHSPSQLASESIHLPPTPNHTSGDLVERPPTLFKITDSPTQLHLQQRNQTPLIQKPDLAQLPLWLVLLLLQLS